jgi:hypothetical protein
MKTSFTNKVDYHGSTLTSAALILLSITFCFIISCIELAFQLPLLIINIPLAYLLANAVVYFYAKVKTILISNVICVGILVLSYLLLANSYDVSWDGQWYHQDAIIKLAENWNPFYATYDAQKSISESDIWIHHYPQASWIVQANIFKLTGSIQSTKLLSLVLSFSCFGIAYFLISAKLKITKFASFLFSLCIAFNPITYSQFFSFYVDGQSAMGISIYVLLLYYLLDKPSVFISLILASVFIYIVNIKFTNLVYLSIFNFFFFAWYFLKHPQYRIKTFIGFSIVYVLAVFVLGYSSYTRNTVEKGHPFYPLMGENNVGEIVGNIHKSANFFDQNRFENFIDASFAYPVYSRNPDSSKFRMPFTEVSYENYYRTDSEMSGFGARWSELLIITFILLLFLLFNKTYGNKINFLFLISIILFSVFINEQCFEARYVSQLWLVPIAIILFLYMQGGRFVRLIAVVFAILLIVNTGKIIEAQWNHQEVVKKNINLEIEYLQSFGKAIKVKCKYLSVLNRLKENKIPYVIIEKELNKQKYQFNYTAEENYYTLP